MILAVLVSISAMSFICLLSGISVWKSPSSILMRLAYFDAQNSLDDAATMISPTTIIITTIHAAGFVALVATLLVSLLSTVKSSVQKPTSATEMTIHTQKLVLCMLIAGVAA